jgi:transposase
MITDYQPITSSSVNLTSPVELIAGPVRRRNWADEEKARMLAESADPDATISAIARRFGVNRGLLNTWRRAAGQIGPASEVAAVEHPAFVSMRIADHRNEGRADKGDTTEATAGRIEIELDAERMVMTGNRGKYPERQDVF